MPDVRYPGIKMLLSCKRLCLLSVFKAYRSISNDALCILIGTPPLDIELYLSSKRYNIIYGSHTVLIDSVSFSIADFMNKLMTYNYPYYFDNLNIKFVKMLVDVVPVRNHRVLFTDGSRLMYSVGAAFTIWYKDYFMISMRLKLHDYNTVFQDKLEALDDDVNWYND